MGASAACHVHDRHLTAFRELDEEDGQRPDLMFPDMGPNGTRLFVDIRCTTPTTSTYVTHAALTPGYAITRGETEKNAKYLDKCLRIGASFMPLVFETFGRTSEDVSKLVKDLVRRAAGISHFPYALLLSYWKKRLSTALQVGNAEFLLSAIKRILASTSSSNTSGRDFNSAAMEDSLVLERGVRGPRISRHVFDD